MGDEKIEDKSENSKKNHMTYYRSLSKIITDIENEMSQEGNSEFKNTANVRIEANESKYFKKSNRESYFQR